MTDTDLTEGRTDRKTEVGRQKDGETHTETDKQTERHVVRQAYNKRYIWRIDGLADRQTRMKKD